MSICFSIGRRCGGGFVRRFSLASKFIPWPRVKTKETRPPKIISMIPQLMLSSPTKPYARSLYHLEDSTPTSIVLTLHRDNYLPQLIGPHCIIGSSHGFLFTVPAFDFGFDAVALNLLSGREELRLPSIRKLPRDFPSSDRVDEPSYNVLSVAHTKLILSPSLDTAVLIRRSRWGNCSAHFSRLRSTNNAWTPIPLPMTRIDDCIFHKGRFIAINHAGDFATFNHTGDRSKPQPVTHCNHGESKESYRKYLVQSPDGDDLFLVRREELHKHPPWKTRHFWVSRLDENDRYMWKPVDSLGGLAFFVGTTHSFSLPAADFPCLKPDSIYFTMDLPIGRLCLPACRGLDDTGVFDLQDGTIQFFQHPDAMNVDDWLPPAWIVPVEC